MKWVKLIKKIHFWDLPAESAIKICLYIILQMPKQYELDEKIENESIL